MNSSRAAGFVPISIILNVVLTVLVLAVGGFAVWAYMGYQDFKENSDAKVDVAVKEAKTQQKKEDDTAFAEQEKLPTRQLVGPDELGSVTLDYPKTWSVYVGSNGSVTPTYEAYLYPGAVPPTNSNTPNALRVSVLNEAYENTLQQMDQFLKTGDLKASSVTLNGVTGVRFDGKLSVNTQGSMVVFKVRDKTLKVFTESETFRGDFDKIILPSLKFNK
ncbi:MAG TPA: hypothetical protein VLA88_01885 [Candidatus Saccharimonadales bacterium]|nr:hypothetical protein [Candidatus Saccharimonadales bacterium]